MTRINKVLIGLSVTLNLLIVAVVVGVMVVGDKFVFEYFLKPSHDRWVTQFELLPVQAGDTVFLGDSITEGGAWDELFPGVPVRNRGISGDVTAGVLKRLHQVTNGKPGKVFLLIGTNDLAQDIAPAEVAKNINKIIDGISSSSPDTQVYVQSVLPRAADYRDSVEELNGLLKSSIVGKAEWIDLYPLFVDSTDGTIRNDLSNDELHLLGQGYLVWRDAIREKVGQ